MHTIDITNTIKVHYSATGKWVSVQVSLTQGKGEGWWQELRASGSQKHNAKLKYAALKSQSS